MINDNLHFSNSNGQGFSIFGLTSGQALLGLAIGGLAIYLLSQNSTAPQLKGAKVTFEKDTTKLPSGRKRA